MKALVGAFNQEKALVRAFSVIVQLHRLIDLRHYGEVTLYAAHEATGEVSRLRLAADLGTVTTLETVQLPGAGPAHVLADRERVSGSGLEVV